MVGHARTINPSKFPTCDAYAWQHLLRYLQAILLLQRFKERLGLILEREDEMSCLVEGCNFLLKAGDTARC